MKKTIIGTLIAATMAIVTGCKTVWTVDESYKVGTGVGFTTAYVLNNQAKVDDATRNTIIKIMDEVQMYVPGSNETFYAAWTPIVNKFVDNAVANKDLTEKQGERVKKDFGYVVSLLDSYVEKKGIKPYQDCINAFVDGFCTKFLTDFKPANEMPEKITCSNNVEQEELDQYAYSYLSAKLK